ncbi:metallophosphoesterase family protein [Sabulicella rubraurantiaca]|uniref:metallophosphoesterase family protein n=1 Tax=Sabulicella rubraurantiaca TaxID=2811429 RepID=UPI001A96F795|nr:metallophosphoesterase [Sabulicella rubraurantiaca]
MGVIRILHISDLHIAENPSQFPPTPALAARRLLWQAVSKILFPTVTYAVGPFGSYNPTALRVVGRFATRAALNGFVQAVLITGDLATSGMEEDLNAAARFLRPNSTPSSSRGDLGEVRARDLVLLLPGNHDRYADDCGTPGCRRFDAIFADLWPKPDVSSSTLIDATDGEALTIVAGDFSLTNASDAQPRGMPFMHLGQGKVDENRLRQMCDATLAARNHGREAVIWAVHFPPQDPGGSLTLKLLDGQKLIDAADNHGVHHILAGHVHSCMEYKAGRSVSVHVVASGASYDKGLRLGAQILEFEIKGGKLIRMNKIEYRFDEYRQDLYPV